jgi:hypothetical protein
VIAGLIVALLLIGGFIGYTWARNDNNSGQPAGAAQTATQSALAAIASSTPVSTATPVPATPTPAEPTATSTPEEAKATSTANSRATRTPTPRSSSSRTTDIANLLPTEKDVPNGFVQTEDDTFTEAEVAAGFADPADATAKLDEWNWREGVSRSFEVPPSANPSNDQTTYLYVSIHRFARSSDAADAIGYFSDALAQARNLKEIKIDPIGDDVIALSGGDAGANEVGLYIRDGSRLIRVTAYSVTGEPLDDAIALAKTVLAK